MTQQYSDPSINQYRRSSTVTADTLLNDDDNLIIADTTGLGAAITLSLPDARNIDSLPLTVKVPVTAASGGAQDVIVNTQVAGQTIDGAASITITVPQSSVIFQSDNSNWRIVGFSDNTACCDLSQTLTEGNTTGGNDVILSSGDALGSAALTPVTLDPANDIVSFPAAGAQFQMGDGTGVPTVVTDVVAGDATFFDIHQAGTSRFQWRLDASADLILRRLNAGGVFQDAPITFEVDGTISAPNSVLLSGAAVADAANAIDNLIIGDGSGNVGITINEGAGNEGAIAWNDGNNVADGRIVYDGVSFGIWMQNSERYLWSSAQLTPLISGSDLGNSSDRWDLGFINGQRYGIEPTGATITAANNEIIYADVFLNNITLNLPAAADGIYYEILLQGTASGNDCDVTPDGADTINGAGGATTIAVTGRYFITANGTNWLLMGPVPEV